MKKFPVVEYDVETYFCLQDLQLTDGDNGQNESFSDNLNMDDPIDSYATNIDVDEFNENPEEMSASERVRIIRDGDVN